MRLSWVILLLCGFTFTFAAQSQQDPGQERRVSYHVCDWGLLTIEHPTEPPVSFIRIESPTKFSPVADTAFTVSGTGAGLFEGNVVVEATANGEVVFTGATVLQSDEVGGAGEWSLEVDLGELESATPVFISAFSPSPADGISLAVDQIDVNVNSEFGLSFVDITTPAYFRAGVSTSPLLVEGTAGAAFENNIVIEARDAATGDVLAESFATIQTDTLGGSGPFSAELTVDVPSGTAITIVAYHPPIAEGEEIMVSDVETILVNPLEQTYERFLNIRMDDPLNSSENPCTAGAAEFDNPNIDPLVINNVTVLSTMSMLPLVNVTIEASGSSNCAAPLRTRITHAENAFTIELYRDTSQPAVCTSDLAPITQIVSLGTLPNPDYSITVNGEPVQ